MIQTMFNRGTTGKFVSFEMSGHAESGPYGYDLVCAACSALSINTINSIESLGKYTPICEVESGYLFFEVLDNLTEEQNLITNILVESLMIGLKSIEAEYKEFIQVHCNEGGANAC